MVPGVAIHKNWPISCWLQMVPDVNEIPDVKAIQEQSGPICYANYKNRDGGIGCHAKYKNWPISCWLHMVPDVNAIHKNRNGTWC